MTERQVFLEWEITWGISEDISLSDFGLRSVISWSQTRTTVEADRAQTRRRTYRSFFERRKMRFWTIWSFFADLVLVILRTVDG